METQSKPIMDANKTESVDLVSVLRFLAANTTALATRPALKEAADEIERLRGRLAEFESMRPAPNWLRICTGRTGNQWFAIPPPSPKGTDG